MHLLLGGLGLAYVIRDEVLLITTEEIADVEMLTLIYPVGDLAGENDYDPLKKTITMTVMPNSWEETGGPGTISPVPISRSLVISQTRDEHDKILRLLRALRAARDASGANAPADK